MHAYLDLRHRGLPTCTPSLKDLAKAVLSVDMRVAGGGQHDSHEDASVTMRLVTNEMASGRPTPMLPPPEIKVCGLAARQDGFVLTCRDYEVTCQVMSGNL